MMEWRHIWSAPKDGTEFLAAYGDKVVVVKWDRAWSEVTLRISPPTHWMPLPEPPTLEGVTT
jgi:hypothetical protein